MIGDHLDRYSYDYLLKKALSHVPDTIDKREGSIIWLALAPACYQLAEYVLELKNAMLNGYLKTAVGEFLDYKAAEIGIIRLQATKAIKRGYFENPNGEPMILPIGSRFSTIAESNSLNYIITKDYRDPDGNLVAGTYELECETVGTVGNSYIGNLLPITYRQTIRNAFMSTLIIPARDIETDDELRERCFEKLRARSFGWNVAQYKEEVKKMNGVGGVQVYSAWEGGGTVKLSIVDAEYNTISTEFARQLQLQLDPENAKGDQGHGLGMVAIGHKVTIVTPTITNLDITCDIMLKNGFAKASVQQQIEDNLAEYILELRRDWDNSDMYNDYYLNIYIARINATIFNSIGVANVTKTLLNNDIKDLILQQDSTKQNLPYLRKVVVNVV